MDTTRRATKHLIKFLPAVVLAASAISARAQPVPTCATLGTGFEDLTESTTYTVGSTFRSGPAEFAVQPFTWSDGRMTEEGFATVDPPRSLAGGTGLEVQVNNVLLAMGFAGPLNSLSLPFGEYGGNVNLEVNGDLRNVDDFADLSGSSIGGAQLIVLPGPQDGLGTISLEGTIQTVAIGGQELWIDNVAGDPVCPDLPIDLAVRAVSQRFDEQGRRLVVAVVVENLGEAASPATDATLTGEGWGIARESVRSLDAGDTAKVSLSLRVPPGAQGRTASFVVTVDPDDVVDETDPGNNTDSIPDLLVPTADLAVTIASKDIRADLLVIDVLVRNEGERTSRLTTVESTAEGWPVAVADVPRLGPGEEAALSLELRIPTHERGKSVKFVVTIDPDDVVPRELDEFNNSTETTARIPLASPEPNDGSDGSPWLPITLAAVAALVSLAAVWRLIDKARHQRNPDLSRLRLKLREGEPGVRVTARPDGSTRHTIRVTLRPDRARENVDERTLR
jgi:hypothetical protein